LKNETNIAFEMIGMPPEAAPCLVVWGHGWKQDRKAFKPFAEALSSRAGHMLVDFPGFGDSPVPSPDWETKDYADAVAEIIKPYRFIKKILWVGHSFGGRVGIQLAARHPDLVDGLFLVASAGLPRRRSLIKKLRMACSIYAFKALKHLVRFFGGDVEALRAKFGSPDYKTAGPLRLLFLKIIRENLSEQAQLIRCPTQLIYGSEDQETPPEIGERLKKLIPNAELTILAGQNHYSVIGDGRHIVVKRLADFLESLQ
jgi:pimeloyl-ACP methyl ester carboxylesterase